MPGPVSDSFNGPGEETPYVPGYCYKAGPRMCPCGHHEGYHAGAGGECLMMHQCNCAGLPLECWTPDEEM